MTLVSAVPAVHDGAETDVEVAVRDIVVGVDGSEAAAAALRWSATVARRSGATLTIVHAYLAPLAYVGPEEVIEHLDPELHAATMAGLHRHLEATGADLEGLEVVRRLHPGRATDGLLTWSAEADLLVVGERGTGGFPGLLLGSTAEHCARHAHAPVVVVPRDAAAVVDRVAVGIDGSKAAQGALRWGADLARRHEASLEVLAVYEPYDAPGPYGGTFMRIADPGSTERFRQRAEAWAADAVATLDPAEAAGVTTTVRAGHPARVLVETTRPSDLVVVGRRGREGFPGLLLGSVTRQLLHHAIGPVAVVPS